jgi:hypothetical protein
MAGERVDTKKVPEVPAFFREIFDGASPTDIAIGLYREMAKGNKEMVWIGFKALLAKGDKGIEVLQHLSAGSDQLAAVARTLLEDPKTSNDSLERLLGIRRWGTVLPFMNPGGIDFAKAHEHAVSHGLTRMSLRAMYEEYEREFNGESSHKRGTVRSVVFSPARTVGSYLPTYFELMGPVMTLSLRSQDRPTALLLGTYGAYSSDDFGKMMKSINSSSEVHVVDVNRTYTVQAEQSPDRSADHFIVNGDARSLQYPDDYFNVIATNFLFNFVTPDGVHAFASLDDQKREIKKIFESAYAALKPGGSFIIIEEAHSTIKHMDPGATITKNQILQIAKSVGFRFERQLPAAFETPLSAEQGLPL